MDPGRLEEMPLPFEQALSSLEQRVMTRDRPGNSDKWIFYFDS